MDFLGQGVSQSGCCHREPLTFFHIHNHHMADSGETRNRVTPDDLRESLLLRFTGECGWVMWPGTGMTSGDHRGAGTPVLHYRTGVGFTLLKIGLDRGRGCCNEGWRRWPAEALSMHRVHTYTGHLLPIPTASYSLPADMAASLHLSTGIYL